MGSKDILDTLDILHISALAVLLASVGILGALLPVWWNERKQLTEYEEYEWKGSTEWTPRWRDIILRRIKRRQLVVLVSWVLLLESVFVLVLPREAWHAVLTGGENRVPKVVDTGSENRVPKVVDTEKDPSGQNSKPKRNDAPGEEQNQASISVIFPVDRLLPLSGIGTLALIVFGIGVLAFIAGLALLTRGTGWMATGASVTGPGAVAVAVGFAMNGHLINKLEIGSLFKLEGKIDKIELQSQIKNVLRAEIEGRLEGKIDKIGFEGKIDKIGLEGKIDKIELRAQIKGVLRELQDRTPGPERLIELQGFGLGNADLTKEMAAEIPSVCARWEQRNKKNRMVSC